MASKVDSPLRSNFKPAREDKLGDRGDVIIIGAGLAGLFTALKLAPMHVTVLAATPLGQGTSSAWAQGGIAAAVGTDDSPSLHAADTLAAGSGLVDMHVAQFVAEEGPARIDDLLDYGVPFDRDAQGHLLLGKEAAHSSRRILRVLGDRTGAAMMQALIDAVKRTPSMRVLEGYEADDLIVSDGRVDGVRLVRPDSFGNGTYEFVPACAVVLATGGVGGLFSVTTNPAYARGESIAMAARAGAVIGDAEFVQFHPTALNVGAAPAPLATEALRGEGAILVNGKGERFMSRLDARAELSPRDIVARGVYAELAAGRGAFLDCRTAIGDRFPQFFPTVYAHCQAAGIDPATELIPVAPAAHYHMGGVATDARGHTNIPGLWAVGEVAATGLHGANRLASNSLLEAVVFGARAATSIRSLDRNMRRAPMVDPKRIVAQRPIAPGDRTAAVSKLRRTMTQHVGVVRHAAGLATATQILAGIEEDAGEDIVLANLALAARFIATGALMREESRGAHKRSDFPEPQPALASRSFLTLSDFHDTDVQHATPAPTEPRHAGAGQ
ncbi:MAG: L-aspartate oxidase [Hyphomicrobium sp.]